MKRIAFAGASGTGKSLLANLVSEEFALPFNPVGSRSVSAAMGLAGPYDADVSTAEHPKGRRAEFQHRLFADKRTWEAEHDEFVTDRTTADNLTYLALHDVRSVDDAMLTAVEESLQRYAVIFYCPVGAFCQPGSDPARIPDLAYHRVYDVMLSGLLRRLAPGPRVIRLGVSYLERRKTLVRGVVDGWRAEP